MYADINKSMYVCLHTHLHLYRLIYMHIHADMYEYQYVPHSPPCRANSSLNLIKLQLDVKTNSIESFIVSLEGGPFTHISCPSVCLMEGLGVLENAVLFRNLSTWRGDKG